jgi:triosephosphate isomerase
MAHIRTAIIAGNWKMNYGPRQAREFVQEILPALEQTVASYPHILSILCPPTISLSIVHTILSEK